MAGLGRRTFAAGEVLTAGNVMGYLQDQAVMNFAGTAARGSAIGTAVSEGMVSYLADSNTVQAYDGSAWNSLAYASSVSAIPRVGLVPIVPTSVSINAGSSSYDSTTGEITFTGGSTLTVNGVFTSTYAHYLLKYTAEATVTGGDLFIQLKNSGGTLATGYANNTVQAYSNGVTSSNAGTTAFNSVRTNGVSGFGVTVNIYDPQTNRIKRFDASGGDAITGRLSFGINTSTAQYTDLVIFITGQNTTNGKMKIYGYN